MSEHLDRAAEYCRTDGRAPPTPDDVQALRKGNITNFAFVLIPVVMAGLLGLREKGRDLTQSYDKSPYTHRKKS